MPQSEAAIREKIGCDHEYIAALAEKCEEAVNLTIQKFQEANDNWAGGMGGYLCIADGKNGLPILVMLIGEVPLGKAPKYLEFCQEKAGRLAGHPNHESSWESRNEEKNRWGGAIRFRDLILSFSGLPELGDEAAMLRAAEDVDGHKFSDIAERIAKRSKNIYWDALHW